MSESTMKMKLERGRGRGGEMKGPMFLCCSLRKAGSSVILVIWRHDNARQGKAIPSLLDPAILKGCRNQHFEQIHQSTDEMIHISLMGFVNYVYIFQ